MIGAVDSAPQKVPTSAATFLLSAVRIDELTEEWRKSGQSRESFEWWLVGRIVDLERRIAHVMRWNYFEVRCGSYDHDPSKSGLALDLLKSLESCVPGGADLLKREGHAWAKYWLDKPYEVSTAGEVSWDEVPAEFVESFVDG